MDNKDKVVIYHADCPDGFGAAWAAYQELGESVDYIGAFHHSPPPGGLGGKIIYFLDFSYQKDVMLEIKKIAKSLIIIDHHKTTIDTLEVADDHLFDIDHSGAVLSWMYFHKNKPTPQILKYVEGVDLWRFELPLIREVNQYIRIFAHDFAVWNELARELESEQGFAKASEIGSLLEKKNKITVGKMANRAEEVVFEGYPCLAVNSTSNISEIGNKLSTTKPPISIIWFKDKNKLSVSLRSDGSVDVSEIAKKYGGGGHASAAGFSVEADSILSFIKK